MTIPIETVWDGIDAIVLDAVGTLIEPHPPVAQVYAEVARRRGFELDREVVRSRFRRAFREDAGGETGEAHVTDEATEFRRWRKIVTFVLQELPDPGEAFEELWDHFARPASWRTYSDVGPFLKTMHESGLPVALASNFDRRLRGVVAGLPELSSCEPVLVISSEVGYRKPHPGFYQAVSDQLGHPPGSLLMVGDDPENDVLGARRGGLRGLWLDRSGIEESGEQVDPLRVSSLELLGLLRKV